MFVYHTENLGKTYEYRSRVHENWSVPLHIHEYSEFAYTLSGTLTVYINGRRHLVPEGHAVFILPNEIHEYTDETEARIRCAVFSNDFIPIFYNKTKGMQLTDPVLELSRSDQLMSKIEQTDPTDTITLSGLLNLLCASFLKNTSLCPKISDGRYIYHDIVNFISENFRQEITLKGIASRLGYNEKYLSTCLTSLTKMNFRMFLASYRVGYAKQLFAMVENEKRSISDIAFESGFSSINSFNRQFKALEGITPTEYRRKIK